MPYSTDADLLKVQKDILDLNVNTWLDQHNESELLINRDIKSKWFDAAAASRGVSASFDPNLIEPIEQLLRLSVFKTLELAYLFLTQDAIDDPYRIKMKLFSEKYAKELDYFISEGLTYDWDGDGNGDDPRNGYANARLLTR